MAKDAFSERYSDKLSNDRLSRISRGNRSAEDIEAEDELLANTDKVEPLKAADTPGRNDPCSCGSGKKYKRCCGRGK